ncbi:MAG: helix-turn-helix domain-containing protein [Eubacteriales bacterium]
MFAPTGHRLFDDRDQLSDCFGREELAFVNWNTIREEPSFHIKEAGLTYPDPSYRIVRTASGPVYDYLYVLEYVQEGEGVIETEHGNYPISKGDSYFLRKRLECVYYSNPDNPLKKVWINCAGSVVDALVDFCRLEDSVVIAKVNTEHYFHAVLRLLEDIGNLGKYETYRQSIHRIADILSTVSYAAASLSPAERDLPSRVRKLIDDSPYYRISLEEIGISEHYSLRHINRVFCEQYGVTPKQYILRRKIETAKNMLSGGRHSLKEIAELLGFCDEHHFMNTFKRMTGVSAGAWREQSDK